MRPWRWRVHTFFYLWPAAHPQFADFFPADRARRPVGRAAFSALDGETARGKSHDRARARAARAQDASLELLQLVGRLRPGNCEAEFTSIQ